MRRVLPVAVLSALLTVMPALMAQRGGGAHAGGFSGGHAAGGFGGGHVGGFGGGFSGGHVGGFVTPHYGAGFTGRSFGSPGRIYSAPPRAFGAVPRIQRPWNTTARSFAPGYRSPWHSGYSGYRPEYRGRGDDHGGRNGDHDHYRHGGYYGYGYGYPYAPLVNSWELLPWDIGYPDFTGWDNGYDDSGEYDSANIPSDIAAPTEPYASSEAYPDSESYGDPSSEPGYRPDYAPYQANPWAARQPAGEPTTPEPELTLIFKDGHQQAIHNYALTPDTLIVMDHAASGRQQQIPLALLDLPATEQAAQQAGLQFHPPA